MKVHELIEELQRYNGDLEVSITEWVAPNFLSYNYIDFRVEPEYDEDGNSNRLIIYKL